MLYIGTSGWVYQDWAKTFYPKDLKPKEQLSFFARHFDAVETNSTFYRIPTAAAVKGWHDATPDGFVFAVKLNNYLTHTKRLILDDHSRDRLHAFMRAMEPLNNKARALLVQLPPTLRANHRRLDAFLCELDAVVPSRQKVFCEFRHSSWLTDETYNILRTHRAGYVIATYPGRFRAPYPVTSDAVYIRYHATVRRSNYSDRELDKWAAYVKTLAGSSKVKDVFVYFNNDQAAHAVNNAKYLRQALGTSVSGA